MRDSVTVGIIVSALSFIATNTYTTFKTALGHSEKPAIVMKATPKELHMQCREVWNGDGR